MSGEFQQARVFGWLRNAMVLLATFGGLALSSDTAAQNSTGIQINRSSYFYRLTVETRYRGEPVKIDMVVACGVKIRNSRLTGTSVDTFWFPYPLYAVRLKDNKALAVQTVDACDGQTSDDRRVPSDFLPLLIVYSNADEMTFGIAYMTEDAYENPKAELTLPKATIRRATADEWRRWRATAPRNVLRPEMRESQIVPGRTEYGAACAAMMRLRLPPEAQEYVKQFWPAEKPRFWRPSADKQLQIRTALFSNSRDRGYQYDGHPFSSYLLGDRFEQIGMPTKSGGGQIRRIAGLSHGKVVPAIFPIKSDRGIPWLTEKSKERVVVYQDMEMDSGQGVGFGHCFTSIRQSDSTEFGGPYPSMQSGAKFLCRIDGEDVVSDGHCRFDSGMIFERDEFVFELRGIGLGSNLGADQ